MRCACSTSSSAPLPRTLEAPKNELGARPSRGAMTTVEFSKVERQGTNFGQNEHCDAFYRDTYQLQLE